MSTIDLTTLTLAKGNHSRRDDGVCLMEAVAWFAGEPHSDAPKCADPVLTRVGIRFNDSWSALERQKLVPVIPLLVGTRGSAKLSLKRAMFIIDRITRWHYPQLLRSLPGKPRADIAERLENLPAVVDRESAVRARDQARAIRKDLEGAASWSAAVSAVSAVSAAAAAAAAAAATAAAAAAAAATASAYAYAYAYAADAAARQKLLADIRAQRPASTDRLVSILRDACALQEES